MDSGYDDEAQKPPLPSLRVHSISDLSLRVAIVLPAPSPCSRILRNCRKPGCTEHIRATEEMWPTNDRMFCPWRQRSSFCHAAPAGLSHSREYRLKGHRLRQPRTISVLPTQAKLSWLSSDWRLGVERLGLGKKIPSAPPANYNHFNCPERDSRVIEHWPSFHRPWTSNTLHSHSRLSLTGLRAAQNSARLRVSRRSSKLIQRASPLLRAGHVRCSTFRDGSITTIHAFLRYLTQELEFEATETRQCYIWTFWYNGELANCFPPQQKSSQPCKIPNTMVLNTLFARQSSATAPYDWILAITFIAYFFSAFGNGANDVANAYATSVAARTLSMPQVGFLSMLTEFFGAVVVSTFSEYRKYRLIVSSLAPVSRVRSRMALSTLIVSRVDQACSCWLWVVPK
jgi:hypothetical protein